MHHLTTAGGRITPVLLLLTLLFAPQMAVVPSSGAAEALTYLPPVSGPITDPFRVPDGPYGAGNRGLEYATSPGDPARAVADGVVAFAGPVAGRIVVSVDHPDGLRSSLTGLAGTSVAAGTSVRRGDVLGRTGTRLHLGIRRGDAYLDPAALFALHGPSGTVRLVPSDGPLGTTPPMSAERGATSGLDALAPRGRRVLAPAACPPACKPGERQ